jgi:spore germination protein YaaH
VELVTKQPRSRSAAARLGLVPALVAALVAPGLQAPVPTLASVAVAAPAVAPPAAADAASPEADSPSIQYLQELEHAGDVITFEPGGLVSVPFRPRASDHWQVDGSTPRELPPGNATGVEMRAAGQGSVWAVRAPDGQPDGPPDDQGTTLPDGTAPDAGDTSTSEPAIQAEPASMVGGDPLAETAADAPVGASGLRREVLGFLPYWQVNSSTTVLDYTTLSTIAYFSVGCTSAGNLLKKDKDGSTSTGWGGWTSSKMTSIINAAHQAKTRVVITISCFAWSSAGATTQGNLLGSATARANLAAQIAAAVRDRGADGVNLDFEPIVSGYAEEFTALVRSVRASLNAVAPGYQLTFDTMGRIGNYPIEAATAPGGADAIFVMGYDYRGSGSSVAGSISPLTGPVYDLTDTVNAYVARVSPSKVILGVPYYGRAWSTSSDALHAPNISGTKYGTSVTSVYENAIGMANQHGRRWDPVEQAPWTAYQKQTCTTTYGCVTSWRQLYFDDAPSLRLRYDLVNRAGIRGAGIWALGYDGTLPDLRKALADKFLDDTTPPLAGTVTASPNQRDEGFRVAWTSYDDSTVVGYDVQASVDGGAWTTWLTGTTLASAIYLGADGHTYAFRVRARDSHGNVSAWLAAVPVGAQAAPNSIVTGGFVSVLTDGLRMRSAASTGATVMTTLAVGDALQVIGGPTTADGYVWYQVTGPIRQWAPVDPVQVGGWVAAWGNGYTYLAPRMPVYATHVAAGIRGLSLNGGGLRLLTPDGDGAQDAVHVAWTNDLAFDSLSLRIHRADGALQGSISLASIAAGPASFDWDGRIGGVLVPDGSYVIQLVGMKGTTAYSAPSSSPVSAAQLARFGLLVAPVAPTTVAAFFSATSTPTNDRMVAYRVTFAGPVTGLSASDFTIGGSATGCVVGSPTLSGGTYTVIASGCSGGTLTLGLRAGSVADAVGNSGPDRAAAARTVLIDRTAPSANAPLAGPRTDLRLPSSSTSAPLPAWIAWTASDTGGAGIASYDLARSYDGGAFKMLAPGLAKPLAGVLLYPGHTYRYEVRARDKAGNVGAWKAGPTLRRRLVQQTSTAIAYRGTWRTSSATPFSGGSVRFAAAAGASASYTFTGRAIGFVTTTGPTRGAVKLYVDGAYVTTLNLYAATWTTRAIAYSKRWSASATHTLKLVVVGTVGRPRVDLDALAVIR